MQELNLSVKTGDKASKVFILDSQFHLIKKDVGEKTDFKLYPGLYIVKVKSGSISNEKSLVLFEDSEVKFNPIPILSPVPLPQNDQTSISRMKTASDYSKKKISDVVIGKGSKLFLFGSIPNNIAFTNRPESDTDPAIGLTLRSYEDELLVDFGSPDIGTYSWEGEPWAACDIQLDPGNYVLCVKTNHGNYYKQTVIACYGWQTQIFLQPRNYGIQEKDIRADLINSSILMSRIQYGFNPKSLTNFKDGTNYRETEQAQAALRCKTKNINPEWSHKLLSGEFENPMLALYAVHLLLLFNADLIFSEGKVIVENLRRLLGDSHPDVEAVALKMNVKSTYVFREFPMLAASWSFVLEAAALQQNTNLIPPDSVAYNSSGQFWSNELWLIWGNNATNENNSLQQDLITLVQQETKSSSSSDIFNTLSMLTNFIANNESVRSKILKYMPTSSSVLEEILSNLDRDKIAEYAKRLGIPHQKVMDLISQLNLEDLKSSIDKFNVQLPLDDDDDPQKGKWGGESERNFRKIEASVKSSKVSDLFKVRISVKSTKTDFPLVGKVKFYLHDTFFKPTPTVLAKNGEAVLKLYGVWGAFTVGAKADDGKTLLELDLSKIDDAPQEFKRN